ncbi:MAG: hypothetical protein R3E66_21535 [bacterium]
MKWLPLTLLILVAAACGDEPSKKRPDSNNTSSNNTVTTNNQTSTNNQTTSTNNQTNSTNNQTNSTNNQTNSTNNSTNNQTNSTNNQTNSTNNQTNSTNNQTNNPLNPPFRLHVQLVWDTPGDVNPADMIGTDMDVHLAHPDGSLSATRTDLDGDGIKDPWGDLKYDCFWRNPNPDWGVLNDATDNPSQDIDDTDGTGPENINMEEMEPVVYRVGAAYYAAKGLGPSTATVRVYLNDVLVLEEAATLNDENTLWEVAWVNGATGEVFKRETAPGVPRLFTPIP